MDVVHGSPGPSAGLFQVIVYPGDDVATEARQGKQGGGRGRGAK